MIKRVVIESASTQASKPAETQLKVLAFTTSRQRPYMLRCCLLQMQSQTYPVDHAIFINTPEAVSETDPANSISLLQDITPAPKSAIILGYGKSISPHHNHIAAMSLANIDDYDLFLKIDDDDIYKTGYVAEVVTDFIKNKWDFSGTFSNGLLHDNHWLPNQKHKSLGLQQEDIDLGVLEMMPPSYALSRNGIKKIQQAEIDPTDTVFEDILWRRLLTEDPQIKVQLRAKSSLIYQVHDKNFSRSGLS
ncbi:MAG: hypothetical protein ACI9BD_001563 [Candidatus Marinamargulisbacteria bacterium]|jgi:hypothetical protein